MLTAMYKAGHFSDLTCDMGSQLHKRLQRTKGTVINYGEGEGNKMGKLRFQKNVHPHPQRHG